MSAQKKLHFVLVPFMAQGHMIPMIDTARILAERGVVVSVIITPLNASRIKSIIHQVEQSGLSVIFEIFRFPSLEVGLPEGCENLDVLPSKDLTTNFLKGTRMLQQPLARFIREQLLPPDCVISDAFHPWTAEVAAEFGIPRFVFHGTCCFALLCLHTIKKTGLFEGTDDDSKPLSVPGLLHRIELAKSQVPGFFSGSNLDWFRDEVAEAEQAADGLLVNSFNDLEPWYIEAYQKIKGKKVWEIGPVCLNNKDTASIAARGNRASIDVSACQSWLDSMRHDSVLYASFGSIASIQMEQLVEIGLGLEASNHPFIWVIKAGEKAPEVERWLSEGFEERTSSRSLIIRGWAPQVMILSHPAIGGFLTHCGWNSTLEGFSSGVPMITWPRFAEQFLNAKLVIEILGVGIGIKVEAASTWAGDGVTVSKEEIQRAVNRLMDSTEEAEGRRRRAKELGERAKKAMDAGGSSYMNVTDMIQDVQKSAANNLAVGEGADRNADM